MKLDINYGTILPELKRGAILFFFFFIACNFIGLLLDTYSYFADRLNFLFWINVFTILVAIFLLFRLLFLKSNIQIVNLIFLYLISGNIVTTDLYNLINHISDWQIMLFRNAFVYAIIIIAAGVINTNKHVILLNLIYFGFLIPAVIISESNYFTENSLIIFLLVSGFSIGVVIYMNMMRNVLTKKNSLQEMIYQKDIELLQNKNELEIKKSNYLKESLIQKNKELTTDAMILAQNKELNKKILLDIKLLVGCDKAFIESKLSDLISELSSINQSTHWDEFQKRFEEVHQDFYKILINQFPDLSPSELKLASFLKLGLSSKDIASITQNTNESIQVARSRLRKKLNLDTNINLSTYLNSI
ncbi:MAG: hypothetical protein HXX09_14375 [Bacteroidetes bacterium]|nr:hypothetical protein [Bacteroidota bacterium]